MSVLLDRRGPITTVVIDRPAARNAVDRATADALADAFRAFDADDSASVAVLWGAGGTFCAGADLKALNNRAEPDGDGPRGSQVVEDGRPGAARFAAGEGRHDAF